MGPAVEYPTGPKLYSIIISLYLAGFLTALDRTIIVNAIPYITNEFNSIDDVGWYGSAYFLTFCAFQLLFGKIYSFYNPKWVFLTAVVIFEIGSAICGAAPNSTVLIVGRAIAGLGSSGIFGGSVIITFFTVPLHMRPIYSGIVSLIFAIASVTGPLIGGGFTEHVTWRWCFYVNLPIGAVTIAVLVLVLQMPPARKAGTPIREQFLQMDPLGNLCLIPGVVCLLLALQWGGATYAWNNGRIIALLVLAGVLLLAFVGIQIWLQEKATIPPRVIKQRSIAAGVAFTLMVTAAMMTFTYYLPIWFQAIKSASPVHSGVMMLPTVISSAVASLIAGFLINRVGYYTPFMIGGSVLMSIGAGLLTTFTPHISEGKWIGYQILWAVGCGMSMQQASLAAQAVLPRQDAPIGISLIFFAQSLGGSVFLSVDQAIYSNKLSANLGNIANLTDSGVTSIQNRVSAQDLPRFLNGYNDAVTDVFCVALAASCACVVASALMEWKSVKAQKGGPGGPGDPGGSGPGQPGMGAGKGPSTANGAANMKANSDASTQA
ncbi:Efflux pump roqT [Penicillium rolfsii]|nr:Efflux pump roqT [Penicillium rolfsii]